MLTAIKGYYNGETIVPQEAVPVKEGTQAIITFLSDEPATVVTKERVPGSMKGQIWMSEDFDEPLEDLKEYM